MPATPNLFGALCIGVNDLQTAAMTDALALDATTLAVLLVTYSRPKCSVGDVAKTACLTHSGAVRAVDRLVSLGLAKRRQNAKDGRMAAVSCTPAGSVAAKRALAVRRTVLDDLLAKTLGSKANRVSAKKIFERLLTGLNPKTRADAWRICRLCEHATCRGNDCPVGRAVH